MPIQIQRQKLCMQQMWTKCSSSKQAGMILQSFHNFKQAVVLLSQCNKQNFELHALNCNTLSPRFVDIWLSNALPNAWKDGADKRIL